LESVECRCPFFDRSKSALPRSGQEKRAVRLESVECRRPVLGCGASPLMYPQQRAHAQRAGPASRLILVLAYLF